ncbi:MAG: 2,3-bisphosphoglycerate-independent phosphoglycerate mutase [Acholeplasma sp.]|nr:2,3-bisphosphoglycerate-independent phosphoglycerate mutase [Acholeplasma sp.]
MSNKKFVGLIILDGQGLAPASDSNSVTLAHKPNLDRILNEYPNSTLQASEEAVGLPEGQMGNSEVGHLNLGAGRVVYQSLTRINVAIKDGSFYENQAFLDAIQHVKKHNSKLHILGLAGNGGVHASTQHIIALNELAKKQGLEQKTFYHAFLDGRDTPQTSGLAFVKELIEAGLKISTVSGRYYAMDRDNNWDRLQKAFDAMTVGDAPVKDCPICGITESYENGITDEFMLPFVVNKKGLIEDNDAIIFANFRPDRAIRIATALSNPEGVSKYYSEGKATFDATRAPKGIHFVSMMHYNETVKGQIAFPLQDLQNIYGQVISKAGLKQLRAAETEKYAHVTFFFDGGADYELEGANRILVQSPKVPTYDLKPEMSAYELTDAVVEALETKAYSTMVLNFANPDMVGHTGSIEATKLAVEAVDICLGRVLKAIEKIGGVAIVLADHGNAEKMRDEFGKPHTAHTTNLVPVVVTQKGIKLREGGALCDVAPTMLDILEVAQPKEMTGKSLIVKN